MTINTITIGPGELTLGTGPLAVSGQITNCRIEVSENVTSNNTDPIKVLSGETLAGAEDESISFSYVLAGTMLQDLLADGVAAWSWANKGTEQAFTFTPNNALAASFEGIVKPVPLNVGGDVGPNPTVDFSWRGKGELPDPTWAAGV